MKNNTPKRPILVLFPQVLLLIGPFLLLSGGPFFVAPMKAIVSMIKMSHDFFSFLSLGHAYGSNLVILLQCSFSLLQCILVQIFENERGQKHGNMEK